MRGKIKLTPLQRTVLAFPPENGLASIRDLLASVGKATPDLSPDDVLASVGLALLKLHRLGCLYVMRQRGEERYTVLVDEWVNFTLGDYVVWDSGNLGWVVNPVQDGVDDVLLQLTIGGIEALDLYNRTAEQRNGKIPYPQERT